MATQTLNRPQQNQTVEGKIQQRYGITKEEAERQLKDWHLSL